MGCAAAASTASRQRRAPSAAAACAARRCAGRSGARATEEDGAPAPRHAVSARGRGGGARGRSDEAAVEAPRSLWDPILTPSNLLKIMARVRRLVRLRVEGHENREGGAVVVSAHVVPPEGGVYSTSPGPADAPNGAELRKRRVARALRRRSRRRRSTGPGHVRDLGRSARRWRQRVSSATKVKTLRPTTAEAMHQVVVQRRHGARAPKPHAAVGQLHRRAAHHRRHIVRRHRREQPARQRRAHHHPRPPRLRRRRRGAPPPASTVVTVQSQRRKCSPSAASSCVVDPSTARATSAAASDHCAHAGHALARPRTTPASLRWCDRSCRHSARVEPRRSASGCARGAPRCALHDDPRAPLRPHRHRPASSLA